MMYGYWLQSRTSATLLVFTSQTSLWYKLQLNHNHGLPRKFPRGGGNPEKPPPPPPSHKDKKASTWRERITIQGKSSKKATHKEGIRSKFKGLTYREKHFPFPMRRGASAYPLADDRDHNLYF